jgi:hypothetical protein
MDVIAIDKLQYLQIGVQGENAANSAPIDMTAWVNEYPDARFHLLFKPYNSTSPLPMVTTYDGETHILTWTPTLSATAVSGVGYTEVRALDVDTGMLKKSRIIPTSVENSVTGVEGGTVPLPYEDWVNLVLAYKDAAEDAQAAAETAQGLAEDAQEAAETAQGKAEDAQQAAETAQGKAEDAQEAAETAQGKAEDAQEAAETAQGKAEDAQGHAEDAQTAAETAQGKAEDAQTAAETAQGKAEDAQEAAETAQGKAEDAQDAAEDAQDAAEAARDALQGANATASTLTPTSPATAALTWTGGVANFVFGIPKGDKGDIASVVSTATAWQNSQSGTVVPTGTWETTQPITPQGYYLWTRYTLTWSTGQTTVMYTISRMGIDGNGSVVSVQMNGQTYSPDAQGVVDLGTVITSHQDISGKADKVESATSGNFAGLDANGNLTDSGSKASDFLTQHQDISGKADKVQSATSGNFAGLDSNGNLTDSGKSAGSFAAPATAASGTAAAGSWSSATPPTQDVSVTGVTANNTIIVSIASTATSAQIDAAAAGKLICTAQGAGTITLTCYGTEPTENIPLTVLIVG